MKITNFTFSDNSLVVYFDVEFKQINYVKMESQSNDSHGILECEEMEIKYSKKKNTLNLFVGDVANTIILLITVFDNKQRIISSRIICFLATFGSKLQFDSRFILIFLNKISPG